MFSNFVFLQMLLSSDTVEMTFMKKNDCGAEEALKECDVVLVMFSVIDTHSLNNIITKFLPHLRLSHGCGATARHKGQRLARRIR